MDKDIRAQLVEYGRRILLDSADLFEAQWRLEALGESLLESPVTVVLTWDDTEPHLRGAAIFPEGQPNRLDIAAKAA